ncbi:MAG: hypothetical protein R6T91_02305 [Bacteroidales bacterium]
MKTLVMLFALLVPVLSFGQETEWTLHQEKNGVMIYQMDKDWVDPSEGINQEMTLLKVVNTTEQTLTIEWYDVRWYNDQCVNCQHYEDPEYKHSLTLSPGESLEGKCSFESPNGLSLFKKFNERESKTLTKFELRELSVNPS